MRVDLAARAAAAGHKRPGAVVFALRRVQVRGAQAVCRRRGTWYLWLLLRVRQAEERELRRCIRPVRHVRRGAAVRDQTTARRRLHHAVRSRSLRR